MEQHDERKFWGIVETVERRWAIYDYGAERGPKRYLAVDIMSPTGQYEWVSEEQISPRRR